MGHAVDRQVIMVVDDDPDILELMELLLTQRGYQVRLWSEAVTALAMMQDWHPDLVITDLCMQGDREAGWHLLVELRGYPVTAHIPAILYSSDHHFLDVRAGVLRMKHCAPLQKPFAPETLFRAIDNALAHVAT